MSVSLGGALVPDETQLRFLSDILQKIIAAALEHDFVAFVNRLVSLGEWYQDQASVGFSGVINQGIVSVYKKDSIVCEFRESNVFAINSSRVLGSYNIEFCLFLNACLAKLCSWDRIFVDALPSYFSWEDAWGFQLDAKINPVNLRKLQQGFLAWCDFSCSSIVLAGIDNDYMARCSTKEVITEDASRDLLQDDLIRSFGLRAEAAAEIASDLAARYSALDKTLATAQQVLQEKRDNLETRRGVVAESGETPVQQIYTAKIAAVNEAQESLAVRRATVQEYISNPDYQSYENLQHIGQEVVADLQTKVVEPLQKYEDERGWLSKHWETFVDGIRAITGWGVKSTNGTVAGLLNRFSHWRDGQSCGAEVTAVSDPFPPVPVIPVTV